MAVARINEKRIGDATGRASCSPENSTSWRPAGLVAPDLKGEAVIKLPKGMGARHKDFRYHLTPVGGPAPNLHVAQQIRGDRFKIAGGTKKLQVSWQVAGEPKAGRVAIEHAQEKPFDEKMAQEYRRHSKDLIRLAAELKDRARPRRSKRTA